MGQGQEQFVTILGVVCFLFLGAAVTAVALFLNGRRLKKKLDARIEANSAFLSASAHQLRAPLNQIVGALQVLGFQKADLTEKQAEFLGVLTEGTHNLSGALMDILDILDLQANKLKIEKSNVNFKKTLNLIERRFRKQAVQKELVFTIDTRKVSHWRLEMDEVRFVQCLSTILSQSIKQTEAGAVSVAVDVSGGGRNKHGDLVVVIKDESDGMDQYMTEAYFSPEKYDFTAQMMDVEGRRLSLMLARMLARKMGGDLTVQSAFGSGVCFQLKIPVAFAPALPQEAEQTPSCSIERARELLADKTILAVDDNLPNLMIMKSLLAQGNVGTILTAENGLEAVKIIARQNCDLVLMDVQMPVLDGLTATREVRKCGKPFSNIPIIALTAAVRAEDTEKYHQAGMNAVLAKPVIMDELFETIERVLLEEGERTAA